MKNSTLWQVLAAIALAVLAGYLTGPDTAVLGLNLRQAYGLAGQLFLNALTLVVVPLVCSSIITGTARMGTDKAFKSLGAKTFGFFISTTFLSILVGYFLVQGFAPGLDLPGDMSQSFLADAGRLQAIQSQAQEGAFQKVEQLLLRLVPTNILAAASQGQMLGLISFCMLFGFFINKIEAPAAAVITAFFQGIFQIMMKITQLVMKALPFGVFVLVAKVVSSTGLEAITSVAAFFFVVLLGLMVTSLIVFPLLLKLVAGVNPITHFKAMLPALVTAFSTSSSAATMPVTIECLEKRAGISPRICSFTIPLGTAINMPGTALHVCASVFFIIQVYGVPMNLATQATIVLMTLLTSFGIAGIPSGSLFAVVTVLSMSGLPTEGVAVILAVERLIDMCRTAVNVFANSCCCVLVAKSEKQEDLITASITAA